MTPKRPLLPKEDRDRLGLMAHSAALQTLPPSPNRAYARGVADALLWLTGQPMSPLLEEVTR